MDPHFKCARSWAEGAGVPTTPNFMSAATQVVRTITERRRGDKQISDEQLAREAARSVTTQVGNQEAVEICLENPRLRAVRLPTNPDMPTNPSVEDLSEFALLHHLMLLAKHTVIHGPTPLPDNEGSQALLEANDDD